MSELFNQIWTPEVQMALMVIGISFVVLYVLCVVWVARDAYARGALWYLWAIVALIPIVGIIAYVLMRPPMMQIDHDEQELEVAMKQRQLMKYGECSRCGYPVEDNYVVCPNCSQRLKNVCGNCRHPLNPSWNSCPYCAAPAPGHGKRQGGQQRRVA